MAVSFNTIPATLRSPLFYAEMDNSRASTFAATYRALLIGQALTGSAAEVGKVAYASSLQQVKTLAGASSQLAAMTAAWLDNNTSVEFYVLPLADPETGASAEGTVTVAGEATADGVLSFYIYDRAVNVAVASGDGSEAVASALAAAINAADDVPVSAAAENAVVTLTAKHKGVIGNDIVLSLNLLGEANGEATPSGLSVILSDMTGGSGVPDVAAALANALEEPFDFVVSGFTAAAALSAFSAYMNDRTGNWSYAKQLYGHVFAAFRGTVAACQTLGGTLNDQHLSVMGITGTASPIWSVASALAAAAATSVASDPARPLQTLPLLGIAAPPLDKRFILTERETLLKNGVSTYTVSSGTVLIDRVVTTYRVNAYGQSDNSYLSVETMYQSAYILRYLKGVITSKYGRHKLAKDGTRFGEGQAIATPNVIRAELIAVYESLAEQGMVEDVEEFKKNLIVEIDANDRNRVNVLFTPDYVNQLNVFALVNQFRL